LAEAVGVRRETLMHPVVRILCFLSLVTALARASYPFILLSDLVFLIFVFRSSSETLTFIWRMMRRMRWFWLSIILLYTMMTPGGGHSFVFGNLELSLGGFLLGLERCLALARVLLYFALLIHTTSQTRLQGALFWLLQPLSRLGVPATPLSIRIALTLQKVHELQSRWSSASVSTNKPTSWRDIPDRIMSFVHDVFAQADTPPQQQHLVLEIQNPSYRQWLLLGLLVGSIVVTRVWSARYL